MKAISPILRSLLLTLLASAQFVTATLAQEVSIPDPALNAIVRAALQKPNGPLTPQDMLGLTNLTAISRNITNLQGLAAARNLSTLQLDDNHLTDLSFPEGLSNLTSLSFLDLSGNPITNLILPSGLTNLTKVRLEVGGLTNLTVAAGLTKLAELHLGFNQLRSLTLPAGLTNLSILNVYQNQLTNVTLPSNLANLSQLSLDGNRLSRLLLPAGLTRLSNLTVTGNQLTNFTVPADMTHLSFLRLNDNQLTSLTLPAGLTNLIGLFVEGNLLTTLVLSELLAATGLASVVDSLQNQGVAVFTYPLAAELVRPLMLIGAFKFGLTGPPGVYAVLGSTNLEVWSAVGVANNPLGSVNFVDATAQAAPQKFYRVLRQVPPANMVFIPPNTFTMGSPTNDLGRNIFEGPQTTVTLTRGFWIGKFEVTQEEYLEIMNENPSDFPGDLRRPISSVTWFDATNYCGKLTQRELAAGRILPGSQYRLPTEAEWECAARAGTTTQFSYGDDPDYTSLTNYAWFLNLAILDLTVHPVGQKLPNPWGLYDMGGNVWEWCQDWYGDQTGGVQTDPTGPASNPSVRKVMRGGAYDYPDSDCRSASRFFRPSNQPDSDLGFRVVLVTEP